MNIAIGKISKSVRFDKEYRKAGKGDLAPMACFISLAKKYPQHKFYVIGSSDLRETAKDAETRKLNEIPDNIIDLGTIAHNRFAVSKKEKKSIGGFGSFMKKNDSETFDYMCEYTVDEIKKQGLVFDFGIFFLGPDCTTATPFCYNVGVYEKTGKKQFLQNLEMTANYSAPIIHSINTFKFPYIFVNEDPRYAPMVIKDILNDEQCFLSHLNKDCTVKRVLGYYDESLKTRREHVEHFIYSGIERTSLMFLKKYDFRNKEDFVVEGKHYKKDGFIFVACNESPSRFNNIKNWILDMYPNVPIYGRWTDETIKGYEDRFINKPMAYLQDEMWRAKYTYIPGFFDKMTNFVTIKIWEMCIYGILPLFDKTKYDTDHCVPVPEFLRCSSPAEMKEKIETLEADPVLYQKYLNDIYQLINDDYFNGEFNCKVFAPIFEKDPKTLTTEDWKENAAKLLDEYKLKPARQIVS